MSNLDDAEYRLCPKCSVAFTGVHVCHNDPEVKLMDAKEDSSHILGILRQAKKLTNHFNILGLQLATSGFLSVNYGTSASISLGIVPIDLAKDSPLMIDTEQPELNMLGNVILRMARSAQVFSTDMAVAGFSLSSIYVTIAGLGIAIPSATASLTLAAAAPKKKPEQERSLVSKVVHSPLTLLENLSHQVFAMAQNFRAVGFELSGLGGGPWLSLTVGTYFGISISVCPIKSLTPLTQGEKAANEPKVALPLAHLTAFQSVILNLLLRANQTVSMMMGGKAEVGIVSLSLTRVGLAIPSLTATVGCVSVTRAKPADTTVAKPEVVKEEVVNATKAELDAVNQQLKAEAPKQAAPPVSQNYETFLNEVEHLAGLPPATAPPTTSTPALTTNTATAGVTHTTATHATASATSTAHANNSTTEKPDNILVKGGKQVAHGVSQGVHSIVHGTGVMISDAAAAVNSVVDVVYKGVETGVNVVIVKPVKGVVQGIGSAWDEVHKEIKEEDDLGILEAAEAVATRVQKHGFRLCNPRWLDLTIGTVLGCAIYIEPLPDVEEVKKEEPEPMPNDLGEAIWHLFKRAAELVEKAADAFEDNAVAVNSLNFRAGGLGLGIPTLTFGIVLDRK